MNAASTLELEWSVEHLHYAAVGPSLEEMNRHGKYD
jgi:hypothetical protein